MRIQKHLPRDRGNCDGCLERCRYSLSSPESKGCMKAEGVARTGVKEQSNIRSEVGKLNANLALTLGVEEDKTCADGK